jgi:hypothetical protein
MSENVADKKHLQGAEKRHITMFGMYVQESDTSDFSIWLMLVYQSSERVTTPTPDFSPIQMLQRSVSKVSD